MDQSSPSIDNNNGETQAEIAGICNALMIDLGHGRAAGRLYYGLLNLHDVIYTLAAVGVWQKYLESVHQSWKPTEGVEPAFHERKRPMLPSDSTYGPASEQSARFAAHD